VIRFSILSFFPVSFLALLIGCLSLPIGKIAPGPLQAKYSKYHARTVLGYRF